MTSPSPTRKRSFAILSASTLFLSLLSSAGSVPAFAEVSAAQKAALVAQKNPAVPSPDAAAFTLQVGGFTAYLTYLAGLTVTCVVMGHANDMLREAELQSERHQVAIMFSDAYERGNDSLVKQKLTELNAIDHQLSLLKKERVSNSNQPLQAAETKPALSTRPAVAPARDSAASAPKDQQEDAGSNLVALAPVSGTRRAESDRMAILGSERGHILDQIVQSKNSGDTANLARSQADLEAIDREIALAAKEPVYATRITPPKSGGVKPVRAARAADSESQQTYASWDVFKNFGHKGTDDVTP